MKEIHFILLSLKLLLIIFLLPIPSFAQEWPVIAPQELIPKKEEGVYFRPYVSMHDYGTTLENDNRYIVGLAVEKVRKDYFNLNLNIINSVEGTQQAYTGITDFLLPWGDTFITYGGWTSLRSGLASQMDMEGEAWQISPRYLIPLPEIIKGVINSVELGLDIKETDNLFDQRATVLAPLPEQIFQLNGFYEVDFTDFMGDTDASILLVYSPGGVSEANSDARFQTLRQNARSNYFYGEFNFNKNFNLPLNFYLFEQFDYQFSTAALPDQEQLDLGGWETIRGYDESLASGDQGFFFNSELHFPLFSFTKLINMEKFNDEVDFFLFIDYGRVFSLDQLPELSPSLSLGSTGFGVNYSLMTNFYIRYFFGFQFIEAPVQQSDNRGHILMVLSF
ncbi:MAG: hypothetical protein A3F16_06755 [Deltaproteobacteria bacterium RIFCSPHIGHO2_12_FULL_43_9]|nr:MAG: hypothetical protein A3F16_06755 [Deltaproteobacteria bacterium RIFCSPHIGHO2_12_FULL_43_9]